uniref:Uncharacterized protein n=1 Tax=Chrysotila carterae TaxID=13221 RepID=A0A7S4C297_CHRCT
MNATTAASRPCYSGMYGTCHECDAAGSCICGKWTSGHSDFITMDRTRWGGIIYVCATHDVLVTIIWAINLCLACIISYKCISGLKMHVHTAFKKSQHPLRSRSVQVLGLLSASSFSLLGLSATKIASASSLIGFDLLPSIFFCLFNFSAMFTLALHVIHLVEGALSTQESTLGRTRIRDKVRGEARYLLLVCVCCWPFLAAPMLGAFADLVGQPSETLEQVQLLLYNGGAILALVLLLLSLRFASRRIIESIAQSCTALKASLAIAGGGVSAVAEQARGAYGTTDATQYRPAHLEVIADELGKLEAMQRTIQTKTTRLLLAGLFVTLIAAFLSCVPYVWNRFSYVYAVDLAVGQVAGAYPIAVLHEPARTRTSSEPPARSAAVASTELMHIQAV